VSRTQHEGPQNLTQVGINQNAEIKKIPAWAAILFAPAPIRTV
jgi:hypothetical protein